MADPIADRLFTPGEVAGHFGITTTTLSRWVGKGWIQCVRTPGGHLRFYRWQIAEAQKQAEERLKGWSW
jgi:excisionase family DNA binding protein